METTTEPETATDYADDTERPAAITLPEDMTATERSNLAKFLSEEQLKRFSVKCMDRYGSDLASRADRMKRLKDLQKMYALVAELKNFPFHKAANVKTPALTGPVLQIEARLYDMVWPATGKVFNVIPGTLRDSQFAHITEQFSNSYVRHKMPYMAQGLGSTVHQMCLYGSAFRRTYWDSYERKVRSDWVPLEDFVVAWSERSQDPSMSNVPRYTMVHHMSLMDLEKYGEEGLFVNVEEVKKAKNAANPNRSEFAELSDKIDGVSPGDDDEDKPRQVLEQHCKWRLPNAPTKHPAFDGKEHYIVVTLDAVSEKVLRISLREEDDPDDKRRFDREMAAFQQYENALAVYESAMQARAMGLPDMAMGQPPMGPPDMTMGPQMGGPPDATMPGPMQMQPPGPPPGPPMPGMPPGPPMMQPPQVLQPPEPVPQPRPIRKRQICFFTHYQCFESDGFYGLGYGDMTYGIALALNTILNQHIDGVTFKNAKPMFMSRQVRMQRGAVNVQPGEVVEIDGPVNDIRNSIMFLDPPGNDPTTVPLVKMLDAMKDTMVGSSDLMSGQIPGSNQTKAGMEILQEQMTTPISVLARRVKEAERHELEKIWRCFGVFLEEEEIADVVSEDGQPGEVTIRRDMFTPNARLVPAAESRPKHERLNDHMSLFGYMMKNPLMQNPQIAMPIIMKMTEEGLRIFPNGEKIIPLLQPPQPPSPQPKPQWAENAGFLNGQDSPVHPEDDDEQHAQELEMFLSSPDAQRMDQMGRGMAEKHLRAHYAQKIMKKGKALEGQRQALLGPGGNGSQPMAGPPGLPAPPPAPPQ